MVKHIQHELPINRPILLSFYAVFVFAVGVCFDVFFDTRFDPVFHDAAIVHKERTKWDHVAIVALDQGVPGSVSRRQALPLYALAAKNAFDARATAIFLDARFYEYDTRANYTQCVESFQDHPLPNTFRWLPAEQIIPFSVLSKEQFERFFIAKPAFQTDDAFTSLTLLQPYFGENLLPLDFFEEANNESAINRLVADASVHRRAEGAFNASFRWMNMQPQAVIPKLSQLHNAQLGLVQDAHPMLEQCAGKSCQRVRFSAPKTQFSLETTFPIIPVSELAACGSIEIRNSDIKVEGAGENELQILSKDVEIKDSFLSIVNDGTDDNDAGLHVNADKIEIKDSLVSLATTDAGSSGSIDITANTLELSGTHGGSGTRLSIESRSDSGQAGNINLTVNDTFTLGSHTEVINQVRMGGQGGDININAGSLTIDTGTSTASSSISTFTDGDGDAGDIIFNINGAIELVGNAQINASTLGNGDAGNILITAHSMLIEENENSRDIDELVGIQSLSGLQTEIANAPQGNSGSITINLSEDLTLLNGGQIVSITVGDGDSGDIVINAKNLVLDSGEQREQNIIGSNTLGPTASGDAGDIYINISEDFEMFGNTFVTTGSVSEGNAGNVQIRAGNLLMLGNGGRSAAGINSSTEGPFSSGNAGSIDIRVSGQLVMQAGANITSDTSNNGDAGNVYIEADSISMIADPDLEETGISSSSTMLDPEDIVEFILENISTGAPSDATFEEIAQFVAAIFSAQIDLVDPDAIIEFVNNQFDGSPPQDIDITQVASYISNALTNGNAGDVTLKVTGDILLQGDVGIATEGESRGNAGNIYIEADSLIMRGSELESKSEGEFLSAGAAGDIDIQLSGKLDMKDGAQIASNSINGLDAGNVNISAGEIEMQGFGRNGEFSEITSSAALTQGNAGNITLTVDGDIKMTDGANVVSDSIYAGQAGIIDISANNIELNGNGLPTRISSTSINANGDAGNINIRVKGDLSLINGGQVTSSTLASAGNAGTVNIETGKLYIDGQGNDSLSAYLRYLELQLADDFDELPDEFEVLPEDEGELLLLS